MKDQEDERIKLREQLQQASEEMNNQVEKGNRLLELVTSEN